MLRLIIVCIVLMRLEITVTRPFMLEVFRLNQENILSADDVLQIFVITENYLFRRNICDIASQGLNKIFVGLNREILRFDGTTNDYVQKFIYVLLSKQESGRFPDDEEFSAALETKQVYQMRGQYKNYLFERFENFGTLETKAVYEHLDNNSYTIEHIMPQRLTRAWTTSLGENAEEIHRVWLHRLANLTLTAYNPNLSNKPFTEKRDAPDFGYKNSGIRMNQKIAQKNSWGLPELEERNSEMILAAKKIWELPKTNFIPAQKQFASCTLDDEYEDLTGKIITKYKFQGYEQPASSWIAMFENVIKTLHQQDKSVLAELAENSDYVHKTDENFIRALKIDENIYLERSTSTMLKLSILRKLFAEYEINPDELEFFFKD